MRIISNTDETVIQIEKKQKKRVLCNGWPLNIVFQNQTKKIYKKIKTPPIQQWRGDSPQIPPKKKAVSEKKMKNGCDFKKKREAKFPPLVSSFLLLFFLSLLTQSRVTQNDGVFFLLNFHLILPTLFRLFALSFSVFQERKKRTIFYFILKEVFASNQVSIGFLLLSKKGEE